MSVLIPVLPPQEATGSCGRGSNSDLCSSQFLLDGERVITPDFFKWETGLASFWLRTRAVSSSARASELQNENFLSQGMAAGENDGT